MLETAENEVNEQTEIIEEPIEAKQETESPEQSAEAAQEAEQDDEVIVSIGEESPPQEEEKPAPEWVRELRKQHRELQKRNRELEAKLNQEPAAPAVQELGKKPTLEDFDYDAEKFEASLANWFERKRQADEQVAKLQAERDNQAKEWQAKLEGYGKAKAELKVKDYDEAEAIAQESLNVVQQGVILQGAENPALLVYALGKNPKKAKELASISDPVKFAFAVAKLETQLKVTNRKAAPPPEKTVQGSGSMTGSVDSTLERLRAEAAKTGDMSKVMAYKRQLRAKQ
jgi:hypothetical protein